MSIDAEIKELSIKIKELISKSPAQDVEKNLHALIQGMLTKMELISREEFDIQREVLHKTSAKLAQLEQKLSELEASLANRTEKP